MPIHSYMLHLIFSDHSECSTAAVSTISHTRTQRLQKSMMADSQEKSMITIRKWSGEIYTKYFMDRTELKNTHRKIIRVVEKDAASILSQQNERVALT